MPYNFYNLEAYKKKQSDIMKKNWRRGIFDFQYKRQTRKCMRPGCFNYFIVKPSDPKKFCCRSCSGKVKNIGRGPLSIIIRRKISKSLTGTKNPNWGNYRIIEPRVKIICANLNCKKEFIAEKWMKRKYCSNKCAITMIGGRPTSPKASRGKGGIRKDISQKIYFYSRWEANFARLLNYLGIKWQYQPLIFDLRTQNYTPDFYLPEFVFFIEIKNFLWKYSNIRDKKFRKLYPEIKLLLLLKDDYIKLENLYSQFVEKWEYKNSPFMV